MLEKLTKQKKLLVHRLGKVHGSERVASGKFYIQLIIQISDASPNTFFTPLKLQLLHYGWFLFYGPL